MTVTPTPIRSPPATPTARSCSNRAKARPTGGARAGRARRNGLLPARMRAKRPDDVDVVTDTPLAAEPPGASVTDVPGVGLKRGGVVGLAAADRSAQREGDPQGTDVDRSRVRLVTAGVRQRRHRRHRCGGRRGAPSPAEEVVLVGPLRRRLRCRCGGHRGQRTDRWGTAGPQGQALDAGPRRTGDELLGPGELDRPPGRNRHRRGRHRPAGLQGGHGHLAGAVPGRGHLRGRRVLRRAPPGRLSPGHAARTGRDHLADGRRLQTRGSPRSRWSWC